MESRALMDTYDEVAVAAPSSTTPALRLAHTALAERAERPPQPRPSRPARHGETLAAVVLAGVAWRTRHIDLALVRNAVTSRRVPNAAA